MVVSVPGHFGSRVVSVPGRFGPWSFQSRIVSNRVISIQSFRFGVVLIPGVFGPGSFGPGSFRLRVISVPGRFVSASGHSGPGRFGSGSFRSHVVHFSPGSFRTGHFRPCRFGLGSWLYMCYLPTYLLTYLYMRLADHFGTKSGILPLKMLDRNDSK